MFVSSEVVVFNNSYVQLCMKAVMSVVYGTLRGKGAETGNKKHTTALASYPGIPLHVPLGTSGYEANDSLNSLEE